MSGKKATLTMSDQADDAVPAPPAASPEPTASPVDDGVTREAHAMGLSPPRPTV